MELPRLPDVEAVGASYTPTYSFLLNQLRLLTMTIRFFLRALSFCIACSATPTLAAQEPSRLLWQFSSGAAIWSPLKLRQNTLYFGNDKGDFFALDTKTKKAKWTFHSQGKIRSGITFYRDYLLFSSDDGFLYMLRQSDGQLMWKFDLHDRTVRRHLPAPDNAHYDYLASSPVIAQDSVFIGSGDGRLYAIDLHKKRLRWTFATGAKIRATPTLHQEQVCVGSWDHHFYCLDQNTGKQRWRYDSKGIIQASALFADGKLIFGGRTPALFALDANTGKEVWRSKYADGSWVESSAILDGKQILVGSSDSFKLSAFDLKTGREIWQAKTGGWSWMTPLLDHGVVYIGAISAAPYYVPKLKLEAGLFAVRASDGQVLWKQSAADKVTNDYLKAGYFALPAVDATTLYVADIHGNILALRK